MACYTAAALVHDLELDLLMSVRRSSYIRLLMLCLLVRSKQLRQDSQLLEDVKLLRIVIWTGHSPILLPTSFPSVYISPFPRLHRALCRIAVCYRRLQLCPSTCSHPSICQGDAYRLVSTVHTNRPQNFTQTETMFASPMCQV